MPGFTNISFNIEDQFLRLVDLQAKRANTNRTEIIRAAIRDYILPMLHHLLDAQGAAIQQAAATLERARATGVTVKLVNGRVQLHGGPLAVQNITPFIERDEIEIVSLLQAGKQPLTYHEHAAQRAEENGGDGASQATDESSFGADLRLSARVPAATPKRAQIRRKIRNSIVAYSG